jgi:CCR4-NOT transcriptional complex subunit CAF120
VYGQFAPEGQGQGPPHLRAPRTLPQPPPLRTSGK